MFVFKVISFLFPFIKEMILGEKTVKEAIKTNKLRVLLIGAICFSILLNFFLVPRLIAISASHVSLQKKFDAATKEYKEPPTPPVVTPVTPAVPAPAPVEPPKSQPPPEETPVEAPPPVAAAPSNAEYERTKEFFERLRAKESKQRF